MVVPVGADLEPELGKLAELVRLRERQPRG